MLLGGQLDKLEQAGRFLLAVDDERTTKNLVAAMLRVDLAETEHLTIGERTANAGTYVIQIFNFFGRKGQALFFVVFFKVVNIDYWVWLFINGEAILADAVIKAL